MNKVIEKRNFCLMLSLPSGQGLAANMGFLAASTEVATMEDALINAQWDILQELGVYGEVIESVNWFSEVLDSSNENTEKPTPEMIAGSKTVLLSFGMALVQKLLTTEKIALMGRFM